MLFFVEVPTAETWVFSPSSADQTVADVLEEALGGHYVTAGLSSGAGGRPGLAVSYIEAHRAGAALDQWRNYAAETLALTVCEAGEVPRVMDEFYGPAVFHSQTRAGPGWLTETTVDDLAGTARQIASGHHVFDTPKAR